MALLVDERQFSLWGTTASLLERNSSLSSAYRAVALLQARQSALSGVGDNAEVVSLAGSGSGQPWLNSHGFA